MSSISVAQEPCRMRWQTQPSMRRRKPHFRPIPPRILTRKTSSDPGGRATGPLTTRTIAMRIMLFFNRARWMTRAGRTTVPCKARMTRPLPMLGQSCTTTTPATAVHMVNITFDRLGPTATRVINRSADMVVKHLRQRDFECVSGERCLFQLIPTVPLLRRHVAMNLSFSHLKCRG